jgi:hypothetical protein
MNLSQKTAFRSALDKKFGGSLEKLKATVDQTLSEKARAGRLDVSQSIMCLRVANILRKLRAYYGVDFPSISEFTRLPERLLEDINLRSVLLSTKRLGDAEVKLQALLDMIDDEWVEPKGAKADLSAALDRGVDTIPVKG